MKLLTKSDIRTAIKRCKPSMIAVAYCGADWDKYIPDCERLNDIIISPTLGSNPDAISEIKRHISWDKVHFLDDLHAKFYIGNTSAIIGSANLTGNGLDGRRLIEVCVSISDNKKLEEMRTYFDELKRRAQAEYPSDKAKEKQLVKLKRLWRKAWAHGFVNKNKDDRPIDFKDYKLREDDQFYVIDCQEDGKYEYGDDVDKSIIENEVPFKPSEKVKSNKWVLIQNSTNDHSLKWMYIHDVIRRGTKHKEYSTLAITRDGWEVPPEPFKLTRRVKTAFKNAITSIKGGRLSDKELLSASEVSLLIEKMKEGYTEQKGRIVQ